MGFENICNGECGSEGFMDASGVLYCDVCGKPDVSQVLVRLQKSIKRHDSAAAMDHYATIVLRTIEAAQAEVRR